MSLTASAIVKCGICIAFSVALLGFGSTAYADFVSGDGPLGSQIVCHVYTSLNGTGSPIPTLSGGDCPENPPAPPPPPSPSPSPSPSPTPAPTPSPTPSPAVGQCENDADDDEDTFSDEQDPNCHTDGNPSNSSSYDPSRNEAGALPACWNGLDDDSDGKTDYPNDPGCSSATDTDETDPGSGNTTPAQCADGLDNDSDGAADLADLGCTDASDNDESNSTSSGGSPSTGSGSSSGGGGGGGGSSKKAATTTPQVLGAATTTPQYSIEEIAACDRYLTAFIRDGQANDIEQVRRLQRFLNDFEGATLPVDGFYGTSTLGAVHAFQTKYAADILIPWGIDESTGYVYLTTRKKVNEIFCNFTKSFPLTPEEQAKVDAARAAHKAAMPPTPVAPQTPARAPEKTDVPSETGAAESSGTPKGLLDFLKGIFEWGR